MQDNGKFYEIQFPISAYTFPKEARAERLFFDDDYMHIHLTDGRIVSVPLEWIPTLAHAKPGDREKYSIVCDGLVLSWNPDECGINEDLIVETWLRGGVGIDSAPESI